MISLYDLERRSKKVEGGRLTVFPGAAKWENLIQDEAMWRSEACRKEDIEKHGERGRDLAGHRPADLIPSAFTLKSRQTIVMGEYPTGNSG